MRQTQRRPAGQSGARRTGDGWRPARNATATVGQPPQAQARMRARLSAAIAGCPVVRPFLEQMTLVPYRQRRREAERRAQLPRPVRRRRPGRSPSGRHRAARCQRCRRGAGRAGPDDGDGPGADPRDLRPGDPA